MNIPIILYCPLGGGVGTVPWGSADPSLKSTKLQMSKIILIKKELE